MTTQRELNRLLDAFFTEGTTELADRVIDAALDTIDHTTQRRAMRVPRRLQTMPLLFRLAAAAAIGVLAVGAALYLIKPAPTGPGTSSPTPGTSAIAPAPSPTERPTSPPAPTPDIPELTGVLGVGRQIQTATVLADGRVLLAGGYDNKDRELASAVVYDPGTDAFSPTGRLTEARGYHTATRLADGRVLITGGGPAGWLGNFTFLASAELYDPATGTFSPTGSMTTAREVQTATLLADGRVLVVGGMDTQSHATASAELYDPTTGTFSATGSLATARAFHTATLLADGRVLIAGGSAAAWSSGSPIRSAEIYDPATGNFTETGAMAGARTFHTATRLADGRVLVAGGDNGYQAEIASAELYDPATGVFTATGTMTDGRAYHTATLLADGRILVAGGGTDYANRVFIASAELYDPTTGTFSPTGPLATARTYHATSLLNDGRVLATGGYGAQAPLPSAELYDPVTGTFGPAG